MKLKTSITLNEATVQAIDELAGPGANRSRVIERAVIEYLERRRREVRDRKDLEILNRNAERLNREVEDVLAYQAEP
ncbi:MAG TPA: ribbon-helix-helix protein, CopG family [Thermoanaerobaculia bacterium]|nr:ribbon-helix-helix protein, CopG family [Thermoanaerobaculia bacterium]